MNKEYEKPKNLDEIYKSIKSYGRYQLFFLLTIQFACWNEAMERAAGPFGLGGLIPTYTCHDTDLKFVLDSPKIQKNSTGACQMIMKCRNLTTENAWYSMYEEFDWVCESNSLRTFVATVTPIISLTSYFISGHISDYVGRKWLVIWGFGLQVVFGFAQAFAPNMLYYNIAHILLSISRNIYSGASFALTVESVHSKYRLLQGFGFQFSIGFILAGLSCYFTKNWRKHLLVTNIFGVPVLLMMLRLEESPRFLIQKKRYLEASQVINRMARFNGASHVFYTEDDLREVRLCSHKCAQAQRKNSCTKNYNFLYLFANMTLALYALSQIATGITINIANTVVFSNIQDLAGCPFINLALLGVLRLWTPFVGVLLENGSRRFGRKKLMIISQGLVAFCFTLMFVINLLGLTDTLHIIGSGCVLLGFALETGMVWIVYKLYSTELFPTVIRTIALTTFSCTSVLGAILMPQLVYLKKYWHPAPFSAAAISSTLSVILATFLLPETKYTALPDTIYEATERDVLPCENEEFEQKSNLSTARRRKNLISG